MKASRMRTMRFQCVSRYIPNVSSDIANSARTHVEIPVRDACVYSRNVRVKVGADVYIAAARKTRQIRFGRKVVVSQPYEHHDYLRYHEQKRCRPYHEHDLLQRR